MVIPQKPDFESYAYDDIKATEVGLEQVVAATRSLEVYEANLELFDKLEKRMAKLEDGDTSSRNFSLVTEKLPGGGQDIVLIHRTTGKRFSFVAEFLKHDYLFETGTIMECDHQQKRIYFLEGRLDKRGFVLSLLHEVCHATRRIQETSRPFEDIVVFTTAVAKFLANIRVSVSTEVTETGKKQTNVLLVPQRSIKGLLPEHYQRNARSFNEIDQERTAWAMAIRLARRLEKEGFNILAGFDSMDEVKEYITCCLLTYDLKKISNEVLAKVVTSPDQFEFPFSKIKRDEI